MTGEYTFRPFNEDDLDMVARWLTSPDVAVWYRDPDYIDELEDHLADKRIRQQIVSFKGVPFAYLQDYDVYGWKDHHLSFLSNGARGLDTFIGASDMIGSGHGTRFIRSAVKKLFQDGAPALGIDPDPQNIRAIRAYQKVGFKGDREVQTEWGRFRIMHLNAGAHTL